MATVTPIKQKANNLVKAMSHGPTRLMVVAGFVLMVIGLVIAYSILSGGKPSGAGTVELADVPDPVAPRNGHAQPVNSQAYEELSQQGDKQAAEQARVTGGSAMPMPRPGQATPEAAPEPVLPTTADPATPPPSTAGTTGQAAQTAQMEREKEILARYQTMAKQFDLLAKRWDRAGARGTQSIIAPENKTSAESGGVSSGQTQVQDSLQDEVGAEPLIRANETYLGVAISEANTDDSFPIVRAKILNGPAKGALLMGTIETTQQAPGGLVRFKTMTPANGGASIPIDAVAIDPVTSRSSVASDVNRHTASRMAALFFSSILSGVSEGLIAGGQQEQVITSGNNVVVQRDAFSDRQLAAIGLGKVGTNSARLLEPTINRKPTVKLNLNTEIGVLFLQDLTLVTAGN